MYVSSYFESRQNERLRFTYFLGRRPLRRRLEPRDFRSDSYIRQSSPGVHARNGERHILPSRLFPFLVLGSLPASWAPSYRGSPTACWSVLDKHRFRSSHQKVASKPSPALYNFLVPWDSFSRHRRSRDCTVTRRHDKGRVIGSCHCCGLDDRWRRYTCGLDGRRSSAVKQLKQVLGTQNPCSWEGTFALRHLGNAERERIQDSRSRARSMAE